MMADPVAVRADTPIDRFMDDVFLARRHTAYPVLSPDGTPLGLVSFRHAAARPRAEWPRRNVTDIMVPLERALVVDADAELAEAYARLLSHELHRGLVLDDGRFAGLLSLTDAARVLEAASGASTRR